MQLAPTPKDTLLRDGTAQLYRFRSADPAPVAPIAGGSASGGDRPVAAAGGGLPVLLVPSLINRWYVLDLRAGASLATALCAGGLDTFCLDWGMPEDEDRYLTWDDVLARLARAVRAVKRVTGAPKVGVLGYCMGGTLSGIHAALAPDDVAALVNLAGPFDFSQAGFLGEMTDPRWFDVDTIAAAGNIGAQQMQSGFTALRPTQGLAKWVSYLDRAADPKSRESFAALEAWASDNIPFPAAAYTTYIRDLYQQNRLVAGTHHVAGRRVDLANITCPVLTVVAERDAICPPAAARALNEKSGAKDAQVLSVPGGHVGAVVGGKAATVLYPAITSWLRSRLCN